MRTRSFLFAALFWLSVTSFAFAHASLIGSEPKEGAVLKTAPKQAALTFDEPVAPLVLRLIGADGSSAALDRLTFEGARLVVELPNDISNGTHALSWRVVSADGHPVGGSLIFSIGAPSAGALPDADAVIDWPLRTAIWAARTLLYAGLFFGIGGLLFSAFAGRSPRRANLIQSALILAGLVAVPVAVGLQGADGLGVPVGGLARAVVWRTGFETSFGRTAVVAAIALALAFVGLRLRSPVTARLLALASIAAAGVALAASGHASAASPQWLMRPAVFVHAVAVAAWLGAFIPLAFILRENRTDAVATLRRFSSVIPFVLVVLIISGAILAVVQVRHPGAMLATAYGNVFAIKLTLVAALLAIAAVNRWRLTRPAESGDRGAIRRLVIAVAVESVLAIAILGVVAVWRFTPPPRALEAAAARPALLHIHTLPAMADLTIAPGHVGTVSASIVIFTGDFGPLDAREVTLVLANPAAGIQPIRAPAHKPGDGTWRVDDLTIPVAGRWQAGIVILVSDFDQIRLDGEIDIRP